jgi:uncharacterized membrane protein YvlD (DUF360 family)
LVQSCGGFIADQREAVDVKVFLDACIVAIVLAVISWIVLSGVQEPVDRAFATSPYTRVGD